MKLNLNFASRSYINRKAIRKLYWLVVSVLLCFFIWSVIQILLTQTQIQQNRNQLEALQQDEYELLGTESVALDSKRIEEIRSEFARDQKLLEQDSFRLTALFDRIEELLPSGISIRAFRPDYDNNAISIEGVAKDLSSLQTFLDRLHGSTFITDVYLQRHAETKVHDAKGNEQLALQFSVNVEGVF